MQFSKYLAVAAVATAVSAAPSDKVTSLALVARSPHDGGSSVSNACNQKADLPMCCSNNLVCVPGGWIQGSCSNKLMCCSPTSQQQANPSSNAQGTPLSGLIGPIAGILKDFSFNIDVDAFNCLQVF